MTRPIKFITIGQVMGFWFAAILVLHYFAEISACVSRSRTPTEATIFS
jgi:hypothetical protein